MILLDIIWLLFLIAMFVLALKKRANMRFFKGWQQTQAQIIKLKHTKSNNVIKPTVEYMYHVQGYDYIGDQLFPEDFKRLPGSRHYRKVAYQLATAFNNNQEISIWYDESQPEDSAVDIQAPIHNTVLLVLISTLVLAEIALLLHRFALIPWL